jgi:hypothetical protein
MIRAATCDTAAEIAPESVPPLHLPTSRPHGRRGSGRSSGRSDRAGWRRLAAPLAAAAAVIAVIVVTVALAGAGPGGRHPGAVRHSASDRGHSLGSGPSDSARLDQEVLGLYLPATGAQDTTGNQLETLQLTIAAACTAQSGFKIPHFQAWAAAYTAVVYGGDTQFPDLARISRAGTLGGGSVAGLPLPAGADQRAVDAAFNRCHSAVSRAFRPVDNASSTVADSWGTIVTRIQASAPVRATLPGLRSCAARYGWPAQAYGGPDSTINSFGDFTTWVAGYLDGAVSRGLSSTRLERHWAHVFVTCGRPTIAVQERLQSARRASFLQQHRRQVQSLEAVASRVVAGLDRKYGATGTG